MSEIQCVTERCLAVIAERDKLKAELEEKSKALDRNYIAWARNHALIARAEKAEAMAGRLAKTALALKSAAWTKPIQQVMYGDHIPLKEFNEAIAAYDQAKGEK